MYKRQENKYTQEEQNTQNSEIAGYKIRLILKLTRWISDHYSFK